MTIETAMHIAVYISLTGAIINAVEYLFLRKYYCSGNLLGWDKLSLNYGWASALQKNTVSLFNVNSQVLLQSLKIVVALCVFAGPGYFIKAVFLLLLALLEVACQLRCRYGMDGSDQMFFIMYFFSACYFFSIQHQQVAHLFFCIIAIQAILSYVIAGIAKVLSKEWQKGIALHGILSTRIYGNRTLSCWLSNKKILQRILSGSIVVFEISFLFVPFISTEAKLLLLTSGIIFHLANAFVMGLNSFFTAFIATYPLLYCFTL